ncbi:hypothetical protein BJ878DRAFT_111850 [Calycina marina]|uniref:Uncharacterized protein n=1 Tax=Calycina marina TaxID=1763456 RepID=A0A9P8CI56_9HELO|nr:hypothetical protein BJ878DRAFT_111850 [Calycina marina]
MSTNWNFREILDINPDSNDFECVGINASDDSTCFNKRPLLSEMGLAKACGVLNQMDHVGSLKASFNHLDELARLCLCVVHSDAGTEHITTFWKKKVVHHMKKEVTAIARPKTRRPIEKQRGNSQSLDAVVEGLKINSAQAPLSHRTDSISEATKRPAPSRAMSNKISSLISEVGFQDPTNENYTPIGKASKIVPSLPASCLQRRDTADEKSSRNNEWVSEQLSSITRPHPRLQSARVAQKDFEEGLAAFVDLNITYTRPRGLTSDTMQATPSTPKHFSRPRTGTMSSTGSSSTSRSNHSSTDSAGYLTSASSVGPSPATKPTVLEPLEDTNFKPISLPAPVLQRRSTEDAPLPKFDFFIFSNLPLPPGHKRSIAERNKRMSITSNSTSIFELDPGYKHAKCSELDPSWSEFPALTTTEKQVEPQLTSKNLNVRPGSVKPLLPRRSSDRLRLQTDLSPAPEPVMRKPTGLRPKTPMYDIVSPIEESRDEVSWLKTDATPRQSQIEISPLPKDGTVLLQFDSIEPTRTSWMVSPISRPASRKMSRSFSRSRSGSRSGRSSRNSSPAPSRSESPAPPIPDYPEPLTLTRKLSLGLSRTPSNLQRTPPAITRAPSLFTRTLSRTLSRSRSSSKARPQTSASSPALHRRATDSPSGLQQSTTPANDGVPLNKLIAMSHELARRLDGEESYGEVVVRPSSSYKFRLPSARLADAPPLPELRMSRLFIGLDLDVTSHQKFSQLDFRIPRKAVAQEVVQHREQMEQEEYEREQNLLELYELERQPRGRAVQRQQDVQELDAQQRGRGPQALESALPRSRSLGATNYKVEIQSDNEAWPLVEDDTLVCDVCGGQHGVVWKCGRVLERAVFERGTQKKKPTKESRRKSKKNAADEGRPRRGTIRRIRMRVVRALTV